MKVKAHVVLMATSFVPVAVFKIIARTGDASLGRARLAAVTSLLLALIQVSLSRRFLKTTTYLEKAFLGFLLVAAGWLYVAPAPLAMPFVMHATTMLYIVLFLTTLVPQLAGYDPFTYAIAKQWYPESVWNMPQFRTINLHITYVWSVVFLAAAASSWLGSGKPLFSIVVPLVFVLGVGLPFSRVYPGIYLKRTFKPVMVDPSLFPSTARELITGMPLGFQPGAAGNLKAEIQFDLSGNGGGKMVLAIRDGQCVFREGEVTSPTLTIHSSGETWLKIARGEVDRPKALMDGLFSVEGDMSLLMRLGELFRPPAQAVMPGEGTPRDQAEPRKQGGKAMKILAVQGSPRPKVSNTEKVLQAFLRGAESQGAVTETIYLKEREIHPCIGCYTCWTKTPGVCVFKDDMPELMEKVKASDVLVYATPLYNFNMTAYTKAFQERLLPLLDPHLVKSGETYGHPTRYDITRRMVLISTCGFPEITHFDALRQIFHHIERATGSEMVGELLVPAAEMSLKQEHFKAEAQRILDAASRAGAELVAKGRVSAATEAEIQKPLLSADQIAEMANIWWDSYLQGVAKGRPQDAQKLQDVRLFLKGMALSLNSKAARDLTAVIQFEVSGEQPGNWYLSIEDGTCVYNEGIAAEPTLTIATPSEVWIAISNGELDGQQALLEGRYTVRGDVSLLMRMKTLFVPA